MIKQISVFKAKSSRIGHRPGFISMTDTATGPKLVVEYYNNNTE